MTNPAYTNLKIITFLSCLLLVVTQLPSTVVSQSGKAELYGIDAEIADMIKEVNESLLYYYLEGLVEIGPRVAGSENCKKAAQYIYSEFEKMGLDVYIDPWRYPRYKCQNVIATLNGTDSSSDAVFIVCAHYDTKTYPLYLLQNKHSVGANDDGSGIASMLTIANILSQHSFNHTVKFIAFSSEEVGHYGSRDYVRKAYKEGENIVAVINLDTLGWANSKKEGELLTMYTPERSEWIYDFSKSIIGNYLENNSLTLLSFPSFSDDHQSFIDYGFDAVEFTQYASAFGIHTPGDTLDKINFTYLSKVTRFILAVTAEIARKPIEIQVRIMTPYEGYIYLLDKPVLELPGKHFLKLQKRLFGRGYYGATRIFGICTVRLNITSKEEIQEIIFRIDDKWIRVNGSRAEWGISPTLSEFKRYNSLTRRHTMKVYAYTESGKIAYDEMDFFSYFPHFLIFIL